MSVFRAIKLTKKAAVNALHLCILVDVMSLSGAV
jgi:hypothetical protein